MINFLAPMDDVYLTNSLVMVMMTVAIIPMKMVVHSGTNTRKKEY